MKPLISCYKTLTNIKKLLLIQGESKREREEGGGERVYIEPERKRKREIEVRREKRGCRDTHVHSYLCC